MNKMIQRSKKLKNRKGFTLIELIVVIAILGILAAILIPQFTGFQDKARSSQITVEAKQIATAADGLAIELNAAPTAAEIVEVAGDDISASNISNIVLNSNGHVSFRYARTIEGTAYTAERTSAGAINVTW